MYLALYIKSQVQKLMEEIEMVTRKYLNTQVLPTGNIIDSISHDVLQSGKVSLYWNTLIPYENIWKTELLKEITCLWSTIRVHAFSKHLTQQFDTPGKKGTRKTLKAKSTKCKEA